MKSKSVYLILFSFWIFFVFSVVKGRRIKALRYKVCVLNVNIEASTEPRTTPRRSKSPKFFKPTAAGSLNLRLSSTLWSDFVFENRVRKCKYIIRDSTESQKNSSVGFGSRRKARILISVRIFWVFLFFSRNVNCISRPPQPLLLSLSSSFKR